MSSGYKVRLTLHLKMANGGYHYQHELVDFPGVIVTSSRDDRKSAVKRKAFYGKEFDTIDAAVEAWKAANTEKSNG